MGEQNRPPSRRYEATADQYRQSPILSAYHHTGATEADTIEALHQALLETQDRFARFAERTALPAVYIMQKGGG